MPVPCSCPMETAAVWFAGVSALAAVAALVWAVFTTRQQIAILRREEADREVERDRWARAEEARHWETYRSQAKQVAAVVIVNPTPHPAALGSGFGMGDQSALRYHSWVEVANASSQPIYDVTVKLISDKGEEREATSAIVLPGQTGHLHLPLMHDRSMHHNPIGVAFRDNSGRRWRREGDGELFEDVDGALWHHHGDGRHPIDDPTAAHA